MGMNYIEHMRKLLAEHEHAADAIRTTLGLLNGHATKAKQNGHKSTITSAIVLDAQRRATKPGHSKNGKKLGRPKNVKRDPLDGRRATEALLGKFDTETPISIEALRDAVGGKLGPVAIGPLMRHGYLKKTRKGYVRTKKAYIVDTRPAAATE